MSTLHWVGLTTTAAVTAIVATGAVSRFTHGRYTPAFYAYQLDRAPDNESTRVIPWVDTILATGMVIEVTRPYALALAALGQGAGIPFRIQQGKNPMYDLALFTLAALGSWATFVGP